MDKYSLFVASNNIAFVFVPRVQTTSSSSGIMTWMEAGDFQLSSRRASEAVFLSLQEQLNSDSEFRR